MVVSERIQFISLGIGIGLLLTAIYPAIETEAETKPQRDSIWESVETGAGSETAPNERREVIQSNATQRDLNPKSLPLDPQQVEPDLPAAIAVVPSSPAVLSDKFESVQQFMDAGLSTRLIVLTVPAWCVPCREYANIYKQFDASESFDAEIQVIDIDKYPQLYRLLNKSGQVPQTHWLQDGNRNWVTGKQSKAWLQVRLRSRHWR